jgi:hypothetical protein
MQLIFNQYDTLDMKISKSSSFALSKYGAGSGIFTPALERGEDQLLDSGFPPVQVTLSGQCHHRHCPHLM